MKIVLLGLEFYIGNKGCEALSYSFVGILDKVASEEQIQFEAEAIVMAGGRDKRVSDGITKITMTKIEPKKYSFWRHCCKAFAKSDVIIDFSMGDSFSDIYGVKRFAVYSVLKELAIRSHTPFILGPQTYGPFQRSWVKKWAAGIIKRSSEVYARDGLSKSYVFEMCGRNVIQVTDVAFALPYPKEEALKDSCEKLKVGMNISGLLWQGGYTGNNQFHLKVDYKKYCMDVIQNLMERGGYEIYLIPHVGDKAKQMMESDYIPCKELMEIYPGLHLVDQLEDPFSVKSQIARMDIFIGARMHATIAAFSSGVATIPVSYSRKFEGLYQGLEYPYVVEALRLTTEEAVTITDDYIRQYKKLQKAVEDSMETVDQKLEIFRKGMAKVCRSCVNEEKP